MGVDNSDVEEVPDKTEPPAPRSPVDGVVRLPLVVEVHSSHVRVVAWQDWWPRPCQPSASWPQSPLRHRVSVGN